MGRPRSFVLRIYRLDTTSSPDLSGIVEVVESGLTLGFRDSAELLNILLSGSTGNDVPSGGLSPVPRSYAVISLRTSTQSEEEP